MKAIIIDDESLALNYMEHQLINIDDIEIVGKYTDPIAGKDIIEHNEVDIVFLDIHIPEMNGIELAEILLETKPELYIVFVTAYDDYAIKAFELNALDYILKPVRKERLQKTIQRIKHMNNTSKSLPQEINTLHMKMFQQVTILNHQKTIIPLNWRTTKVQQLFLHLVHNRGKITSKSELIELLWPEYELKKAYAQLYTAIYHVRKTLESIGNHFKLTNINDGYLLELVDIIIDVETFEQFITSAPPLSPGTISDHEKAMELYVGDYLEGLDYLWAESERYRLHFLWISHSFKMVYWYHTNHDPDKAIKRCLDICNRYPLVEEAYFSLMKIFASMGNNHSSVHFHYLRLSDVLMEELNEKPSPTITEWYNKWKMENKE
ncbi:response regulator [Ferdinandcohnia quinoae]|uniref:Response regulator n=1 Tax=Fredinandcohnia quinoae TaxID=2918902 RepID=A0AAW5DU34_9BACI|nr:response regulator [Fredinandcohnia sp. SECRCQ15]MCH1624137.1 response regulator [Fredinandcohnia sp. SECRCQ15]